MGDSGKGVRQGGELGNGGCGMGGREGRERGGGRQRTSKGFRPRTGGLDGPGGALLTLVLWHTQEGGNR